MQMDELVAKYVELRDRKAKLKADYEATASKITEVQDKIEAVLLKQFAEMGVESVKTPFGTAYTSVRSSASVADWDAFLGFVRQSDAWEFLERRASKAAVEQYKEAHEDLPPGINWSSTSVVNIRRA